MADPDRAYPPLSPNLPTRLIGIMRHEVGDLLQTLYCTVAVLQGRLPVGWEEERRFLSDLRRRAESCKELMDLVRDFTSPLCMHRECVDLRDLVEKTAGEAALCYPNLVVRVLSAEAAEIDGDLPRLTQVAHCLLRHACDSAEQIVEIGLRQIPDETCVEWMVRDDGVSVLPERLALISSPCYETRRGRSGIGMALVHRIIQMHGGKVGATNGNDRGFEVRVRLPTARAAGSLMEA